MGAVLITADTGSTSSFTRTLTARPPSTWMRCTRVLSVTALGASVNEAQARAYAAVDRIDWPEGFCRRDIGWRAVARENA